MNSEYDVVVAGLGPAGMAAACAAAQAGLRVAAVDENPAPGGQVYRQGLSGRSGSSRRKQRGGRLLAQFNKQRGNITVFPNTVIWASFEPKVLNLLRENALERLAYKRLIVCEGAQERTMPFPGWILPGVMTAGGLQKMLLHQRILPGERIVLSGAGPLLFATAAAAVQAGAKVLAVCDSNPRSAYFPLLSNLARHSVLMAEGLHYFGSLIKQRIPILYSQAVVAAKGDEKVRKVTIARLDSEGVPMSGGRIELDVDTVGLNHGFLPGSRLTRLLGLNHVFDPMQRALRPVCDRLGRSSVNHILVAGDGAGVCGADYAELGGQAAGLAAAADLGRFGPNELNKLTRPLLKQMSWYIRYADRLHTLTTPKPGLYQALDGQTVICRCEGIELARVQEFAAKTSGSLTELKPSRAGMGMCQGRVCEPIMIELLNLWGHELDKIGQFHLRPPFTPIPLSVLETEALQTPFYD